MKTPLGSVLFFIKSLEKLILSEDGAFDINMAKRYFKFIFTCLMLMQTFVDDLLDLRQLKEGAFSF